MMLYGMFGQDYWELYHKVTFDGENKLIIINPGESDICRAPAGALQISFQIITKQYPFFLERMDTAS